jgi:hypothetical protein
VFHPSSSPEVKILGVWHPSSDPGQPGNFIADASFGQERWLTMGEKGTVTITTKQFASTSAMQEFAGTVINSVSGVTSFLPFLLLLQKPQKGKRNSNRTQFIRKLRDLYSS